MGVLHGFSAKFDLNRRDNTMKKLKKCIKSLMSFSLAVVMLFSGISPLGIFAAGASPFGVWQTDGNFTVTENGTYVIYTKDAVGNTTSIEITVNNIDYTPPTLNVGYSTTEWTKDGVKLVLTSVDQASPGGTAGTVSLSVVGSDGTSYPTDYLFTSNTSGTVTSTDDVGNSVSKPFSITNVDTTVPKISVSADVTSPTNKNVTLKITGSDAESGLNAKPYSWDGTTWTDVATKSVSTNGVYKGYVRDAVGNISSTTISVANIDKVAPTISGYSYSTETPCNTSVVVTVSAADTGLGLADSAYSFNDGVYGTSNKFTVTANGTYTVAVKDKAGNITNGSFKVSNLDFEAPVISSVVPSTTSETNKDVTLKINATDNVGGLGLSDKPYRLQGYGDWQTSNVVTVTCNGTYTVEVRDSAGNIASKSIEITNIDKEPPTASHVLDITSPTNTDVVATLTILDNKGIKKVVTPDGTVVTQVSFQSITDYTFSKNGSYTFEIWDTADNKTTHTVDISNIDKDKPVIDGIERSTTKECNTYVDITVTAHDVGLGLEAKAFKFTGGDWQSANTLRVSSNGVYSVSVIDVAGNITTQEFSVLNLDFDKPVIKAMALSTTSQTNKNLTLTVTAEDVGLGLAKSAYRIDGGAWQESNVFTITENGTYTIEVIDKAGNIQMGTKEVTNIDKVAPTLSASVNTTDPTNNDVVVTLKASDNVEIFKVLDANGESISLTKVSNEYTGTISESANGTFVYKAVDTAGNEKTCTVKIANIDKSNPVLDEISKSTEDPVNTNVVVTVTAHDVGLGLADKPYKFDNGDWTDVSSTTITSNGTYTVQIKDKAGNVITKSYEISNLDFIAPVISSARVLQTRPVRVSARIAVNATDEGLGLADKAYKLSEGDWQTNNWFDVTDNGTYTVYVRDKAGNISSKPVEVKNIDKVKPEITCIVSTTEPTPYFDVEVVGTDNMELGAITCSDRRVVKGRTNWVSTTECRQIFSINQNGTYRFDVRDFVGNTNYIEITVDNIDNVPPTIDKILKNPDVPTNAPLEITVIASDVGFGLADKPYRVDGGEWQSGNKFMISDNGVHEIDVRDRAGNTLMMTTDISNLDYDNPVIDEVTQDITEQTNTNVVLTVTAHDVGLGLDGRPYKFGDGVWKSTNKFAVEDNGDYVISVRDEAGNIETYTHTVSNIDKELPVASHTVDIDTPTNSDVVITFKATDNVEIKSITLPDKVVQDIGSNEAIIPFTVVKNGIYTFKVLDTAGNITTYPVEIDNIDKNPAEIVASPSVEGWTNQDIELNVVITDDILVRKVQSQGIWYDLDAGELPNGAVVEKGGQDRILKVKFSVPISDNGTFEFKAVDFSGLETTYSYDVTTIDRVDPEISAKIVNNDPTKDNVDIAITASDSYGEVSYIVLHGDNKVDDAETTYSASDNGEYKFTVVDKAGNSAETSVKVGNIDRVAPTFTYELSPNKDGWSNDSVLLKVIGSDESGISAYEVFFGEEELKAFDDGVFQLFENGTYRIVVVDTVGNYSEAEIIVGNIDKDEPTIAVGLRNKYWVNKSNTIVITGQDNSSGVSGYSLDGENWQESNEFKVGYKNSYTVYVKDLAGNVSSMIVYFDLVEEPVEEVEPLPEDKPKDDESEPIVAPKSDLNDGSLIVIGELTDLPIEATEAKSTESDIAKVVRKIAENVAEVAKVVFPYAAVLLLATVGGLVFILLTDGVRVYGKNKKGKWQHLGIARCHKGVIGCTVKVSRNVLKRVDSADYLLKFNTRYSTINKGLELYIKIGNQAITSNVYKQVEFSVMK